jgi:hypothetical protein
MANLFKDIIPDINFGHKNLIRQGEMDESEYNRNKYLINRSLSMGADTIFYVNDMNIHYDVDALLQYDYFINSVRKKKRYNKWSKATAKSSNLELIQAFYNYNEQRAIEVLKLLTDVQIEKIKLKMNKGGNNEFLKSSRENK